MFCYVFKNPHSKQIKGPHINKIEMQCISFPMTTFSWLVFTAITVKLGQ